MAQINFESKIWKQGNSLIITIPKDIVKNYDIKESDFLQISAILKEKKDIEEEIEINRLQAKFPEIGTGVIKHKNEIVAELNTIFYKTFSLRGGALLPGGSLKDLPKKEIIVGIIISGMFLPKAFEKKHYGDLIEMTHFRRTLAGGEVVEIQTMNNKKIKIKIYEYKKDIINKKNNIIKKVGFRGDVIKD